MNNKIDFYTHKSFEPVYYQRQFEHDLPKAQKEEIAKRALHIALPFLSLYRPLGKVISYSMGSIRALTCGADALQAKDYQALAYKTTQLALAVLALAATLYHFTLGLLVTTGADLLTNLAHLASHLANGQYQQGGEELLLALSSGLYLAIMMVGTLEITLASILIQALISFYQARKEWAEERIPEALGKTLMGMIRLYQAKYQFTLIQRHNAIAAHYEKLIQRIQKGRKIDHLWDHPLIKEQENHFVIRGPDGKLYDTGAHHHGYGKQLVKGMNITVIDEKTLDFKVNHVHKERLNALVEELDSMNQEDLNFLLKSLGSHVTGINVAETTIPAQGAIPMGNQHEIHLEGLGKITIGASREVITFYDQVTVEMDEGKNLYDFHEALSFLDLDDALRQSAKEDIDRMKMGQLYRIFDPRGSLDFERSDPFFDLTIDVFKDTIIKKNPEMEVIFDRYLDRMELRETLPGQGRYAIDGLADELKDLGAKGLTSTLTGSLTDEESFNRVGSILENGMLSTEIRNKTLGEKGLSWGIDCYTGGADTVFTQIVTDKNQSYEDFSYYNPFGGIRLTFSPKLLETGTYQYHDDNFGTRIIEPEFDLWWDDEYRNRPSITEFLAQERYSFNSDNEVMIKDRIPPEYITGLIVPNDQMKDQLLANLREKNLVQIDQFGYETILSKKVDDFIFVGDTITDAQFA